MSVIVTLAKLAGSAALEQVLSIEPKTPFMSQTKLMIFDGAVPIRSDTKTIHSKHLTTFKL